MAVNLQYYSGKIDQIKAVLELISALRGILIPIMQWVEDIMPDAKGSDKLKAAMNFLKSAVADSEEISKALDAYWETFTGAVSAFAVMAKATGVVKRSS